jgi:hypothetical protein
MKMKKFKKYVAILVVLIIFSIPIVVFASSYTSTLDLYSTWQGATRVYSGNNITIDCDSSTFPVWPIESYFYTVKLYRNNPWWIGDDYIGSSSFPVNGYQSATWTNVGSGNYYFVFIKAVDFNWTYADPVHMCN